MHKANKRTATTILLISAIAGGTLVACGGGSGNDNLPVASALSSSTSSSQKVKESCSSDFVADALKDDPSTSVLLVKQYKKGDRLPSPTVEAYFLPANEIPLTVQADLCQVKLLVGPPTLGPADAPSTSAGIGIELWFPTKENWNGRIHAIGGAGWSGGDGHTNIAKVSSIDTSPDSDRWRSAPRVAWEDGSVTSSTDTGSTSTNAAKMLNPDGSFNTKGINDFSLRSLDEQAIKTKVLTKAFYRTPAKYSYFVGGSGGGRQAFQIAEQFPQHYDGILTTVPGVNFMRLLISGLYPQIVIQRDLGGKYLTTDQVNLVSNAAINACDVVGGQHLGFVLDYKSCRYDPTKDLNVLCASSGGTNTTGSCVSSAEALAMNKIWYGMTSDGSVPDPAVDNGFDTRPSAGVRKWYGYPRGTDIQIWAGANPTTLGMDIVAMVLRNPKLGSTLFTNATGNGENRWKAMSYADLAAAFDRAMELQPVFDYMDASTPDLSKFKARGGKLIQVASVNDTIVFSQGSSDYYERVSANMGGPQAVQSFYRLFEAPGLSHIQWQNGTTNPDANPPVAGPLQLHNLIVNWVENGIAPDNVVYATESSTPVKKSLPICVYPAKQTYVSGSIYEATSYRCQ